MRRGFQGGLRDEGASQIVEFAVSLPLLVVFVVGIFDFSGAFSLKHKLANAVREGARAAAADPANDLSSAVPASVGDAFQIVDHYLLDSKVDDCGLSGKTATAGGNFTWTYSASSCSSGSGTLTLKINRGYYLPNGSTQAATNCTAQGVGATLTIIATCVSIQYPYPWRFKKVMSLLGATSNVPSTVTATAVAINEN